MPPKKKVRVVVWLQSDQVAKLSRLQAAIEEKLGRKFTMNDMVRKIVDDFLES